MPRNKKNIFDNRDALEILRDAFGNTKPARVAELQTPSLKIRTMANEEKTPEEIYAERKDPGKKNRAAKGKKHKSALSDDEESENLSTDPQFFDIGNGAKEPVLPQAESTTQDKLADPDAYRHILDEQTARAAIEKGLQQKKQIEEGAQRLLKMFAYHSTSESKIKSIMAWAANAKDRAKSEEAKLLIDAVEKRAIELAASQPEVQTQSSSLFKEEVPDIAEPNRGLPNTDKQPARNNESAEDMAARVEQLKERLAEREAEHYQNDVAKMEERIKYLQENKTKAGKTDAEAIDRLQRAIEIAQARTVESSNIAFPAPTELDQVGEESFTENIKSFEKRTAELEKIITETGGTPEQKKEHLARQAAKEHDYDLAKIDAVIASEREKQNENSDNPIYGNILSISLENLFLARELINTEIGGTPAAERTPSTETSEKAAAIAELKEAIKEIQLALEKLKIEDAEDDALIKELKIKLTEAKKAEETKLAASKIESIEGEPVSIELVILTQSAQGGLERFHYGTLEGERKKRDVLVHSFHTEFVDKRSYVPRTFVKNISKKLGLWEQVTAAIKKTGTNSDNFRFEVTYDFGEDKSFWPAIMAQNDSTQQLIDHMEDMSLIPQGIEGEFVEIEEVSCDRGDKESPPKIVIRARRKNTTTEDVFGIKTPRV